MRMLMRPLIPNEARKGRVFFSVVFHPAFELAVMKLYMAIIRNLI